MDTQARTFRVIGRRTPKVDALDKVTGRAPFGADVILPRPLVGKVLRSPYAHARLKRIDTSKAVVLPGVQAVITGNDLPRVLPGAAGSAGVASAREYYLSHELLTRDKVLFHGHVVAAVAATSDDIAEEAVERIEVEYDVLACTLYVIALAALWLLRYLEPILPRETFRQIVLQVRHPGMTVEEARQYFTRFQMSCTTSISAITARQTAQTTSSSCIANARTRLSRLLKVSCNGRGCSMAPCSNRGKTTAPSSPTTVQSSTV